MGFFENFFKFFLKKFKKSAIVTGKISCRFAAKIGVKTRAWRLVKGGGVVRLLSIIDLKSQILK